MRRGLASGSVAATGASLRSRRHCRCAPIGSASFFIGSASSSLGGAPFLIGRASCSVGVASFREVEPLFRLAEGVLSHCKESRSIRLASFLVVKRLVRSVLRLCRSARRPLRLARSLFRFNEPRFQLVNRPFSLAKRLCSSSKRLGSGNGEPSPQRRKCRRPRFAPSTSLIGKGANRSRRKRRRLRAALGALADRRPVAPVDRENVGAVSRFRRRIGHILHAEVGQTP